MAKIGLWNTVPTKHSLFEDAQDVFTGTVLAAVALNFFIAINHRTDRYIAM
ncbi:MAG: hypothetical protein JWM58_679 [Rhizobium sp.]|nr:hypothetical protein [Rhizobium sp.]